MLPAVEFDDQSRGLATKIDDVLADLSLAAKLQSMQSPIPQTEP
jgi:hypothetical protein